ncbi:MAG TPA: putative toxin-antitoxin system toxin component, PIN family [Bryobacteraceae bacterium]|nr:putative toxin-antitoxin system toxin component, PIN family [Bryobacteraceae bacterium]
MTRVVLDTNIIVSALLQPLGPSAQLLTLALGGSIQLCVSGSVYAEYEEVIFLECAVAAKAEYLVTGNLKHFPASWGVTRIVTPRWLLDNLSAESLPERPETSV